MFYWFISSFTSGSRRLFDSLSEETDLCIPAHRSLHHTRTSTLLLATDRVHTGNGNALQRHNTDGAMTTDCPPLTPPAALMRPVKQFCCGTLAEPPGEAGVTRALAGGDVQTAVLPAAHATGVQRNF